MNRKTRRVIFTLTALAVLGGSVGYWLIGRSPQPASTPAAAGKGCPDGKVLYWTDPMVPGYRSDKPGKSPFMDMELVPVCEQDSAGAAPVVTIRPEIINNLGVRTYQVERAARPRRLTADGYLFRADGALRVLVDVFERDAGWLRAGLPAEVRVLNLPGRQWPAVVERVEADIAIGARSLKAVVRLKEADPALKPGLFAEVVIQAPPTGRKLFVPREALIRTGTRTAVVLARGEGRFQPVEVTPGEEYGEWVEIRRGLKEGDIVVTSGQFLIDSEASLRASFLRLQADPEPTPAAPTVSARGVVRAVDPQARRIRLEHEPIPELGWPKMAMDFRVAAEVDLAGLAEGDRVRFELRRKPEADGSYVITAIAPEHRH